MPKNPRRHDFNPGDRVKILTRSNGCYNGIAGTITKKLNPDLKPDPDAVIPHFYEVRTDRPVNIGGNIMSVQDIYPSREIFPINTKIRNYWDI